MLTSEAYEVYTIEAIAEMAGFVNRQNFYNSFEKIVGVKPSKYRSSFQQSLKDVSNDLNGVCQ